MPFHIGNCSEWQVPFRFEEPFSVITRAANCCVLKKIPVELLSASVAKGHIFPLQAHGASGADGICGALGVDDCFCDW